MAGHRWDRSRARQAAWNLLSYPLSVHHRPAEALLLHAASQPRPSTCCCQRISGLLRTIPMSFRQLHVGRNEPILEPALPIIDSHHHLFLRPAIRYLFADFLAHVTSGPPSLTPL